jgi:hypothetical protein
VHLQGCDVYKLWVEGDSDDGAGPLLGRTRTYQHTWAGAMTGVPLIRALPMTGEYYQ